jgi:putative thioredoxin
MTEQGSPHIIDTTTAMFEKDVVQQSMERPVVVDFWATWCEPCQQLAPLLEKLTEEFAGKFLLAKVNVDESPEIAGAFGVQSIPVVVAVFQGQAVNQFMGLLPEPELREWLQTFLPSPAQELFKKGQELETDDPAGAEKCYREVLELDPDENTVRIHLARVLLTQQRDDECRLIITKLEERGFLEPEAERIKSELDLRIEAKEAGGLTEARKSAQANPDDLHLQLQLTDALAVANKHEEALELCLSLIERDKAVIGPEAKETMVKIFDVLGQQSELVSIYRRKLATAWY